MRLELRERVASEEGKEGRGRGGGGGGGGQRNFPNGPEPHCNMDHRGEAPRNRGGRQLGTLYKLGDQIDGSAVRLSNSGVGEYHFPLLY